MVAVGNPFRRMPVTSDRMGPAAGVWYVASCLPADNHSFRQQRPDLRAGIISGSGNRCCAVSRGIDQPLGLAVLGMLIIGLNGGDQRQIASGLPTFGSVEPRDREVVIPSFCCRTLSGSHAAQEQCSRCLQTTVNRRSIHD